MNLVYILASVFIFGFLVFIHEGGHCVAAKLCNVKVDEFAVGMGPVLWQKEKGETLYSVRAIPFGGFCAFESEDEGGSPRAFHRQSFGKKFVIFAAGSALNFLAGFLIVAIIYSGAAGFLTDQVSGFAPDFPLEGESGLMEGDIFYKIDGYRTYLRGDASNYLAYHQGDTIDLEVIRDGEHIVLEDFPMARREYTGLDGTKYTGFGLYVGAYVEEATALSHLEYTWKTCLHFVQLIRFSFDQLFSGGATIEDLSGPVGIVSTMTEIGAAAEDTRTAFENIFYFSALLAVNMAVMNLLPLPALDGGQLVLLLVDAMGMLLFKKKVPEKYRAAINGVCLALLIAFMFLVTFKDVTKLFQ